MAPQAKVIPDDHIEKLGRYFGSPPGDMILDILTETFVNRPIFDASNQYMTAYILGQAELVKFLTNTAKAVREENE